MVDFFGKKRIAELEKELVQARAEAWSRNSVPRLLEKYVDSLPPDERRRYIGEVMASKQNFKRQFESMISEQRIFVSRYDITEHERKFCISNINCLQLLLDWFERVTSEHQFNIEEARARVEEDVTLVSSLKNQYNLNP